VLRPVRDVCYVPFISSFLVGGWVGVVGEGREREEIETQTFKFKSTLFSKKQLQPIAASQEVCLCSAG
jgi:hypothetical protein